MRDVRGGVEGEVGGDLGGGGGVVGFERWKGNVGRAGRMVEE